MDILIIYGIPLLIANVVHHVLIISRNLFSSIAAPLDFGARISGIPFFGTQKTFRGLFVISILTGVCAALCAIIISADPVQTGITGFIVGLAYMIGELPNSFLKRRAEIKESAHGSGTVGSIFVIVDQCDSVLAAALAIFLIDHVSVSSLIAFVILGIATHAIVDMLLRRGGYRERHVAA